MAMQTVEIACCFDRGFAFPAAVLATSILAHADPRRRYRLHAVYDGDDDFGARLFEPFERTQLEIRFQRISNPFAGTPTSRPSLSAAAFVRLALPDLLPDSARVVYLDVDALCLADIGLLFDTDLGGAPLAASLDPTTICTLAAEKERGAASSPKSLTHYLDNALGLGEEKSGYFNSGVLVLDLDALRREGLKTRAQELLVRLADVIRLDDQCVLNALFAKRYARLSMRWNAMLCPPRLEMYAWGGVQLMTAIADAWQKPAVLHFCQATKPWLPIGDETAFARTWRAYASAAPLPWSLKLRHMLSSPRQMLHYARPSVHRRAARIRLALRERESGEQA